MSDEKENRSERITFRVTPKDRERIEEYAEAEGYRNVSQLVRDSTFGVIGLE